MKTIEQAVHAHTLVSGHYDRKDLSPEQRAAFAGMSVALAWVMELPQGSTLQKIVDNATVLAALNDLRTKK